MVAAMGPLIKGKKISKRYDAIGEVARAGRCGLYVIVSSAGLRVGPQAPRTRGERFGALCR
ncbi:hypothetical protein AB0L53_42020 [Nonomuraea sp. NPDC052129]|uniref:hypothetical protein n=1 Tax=Nonomuraea sp. NPDC052129 TaxID=3154651 RepID=UPI003444787D